METNTYSGAPRKSFRKTRRLLALLVIACAGFATQAGVAQAKTLKFSFHDGRVNLGEWKGYSMTDPANPDMLGYMTGAINPSTGNFTSQPGSLHVPPRVMRNVEAGGYNVDAAVDFTAASAFSGNYNVATGVLDVPTLDLTATLSVYPAGQAGNEGQLVARCRVSPIPLPLTSTGSITDDSDPDAPVTYSADPFNPNGASVSTWDSLPASTSAGGLLGPTVCPMVDDAAAGPGGLWMSGRATVVSDQAGVAKKCKKAKKGNKRVARTAKKKCGKKKRR